MCRSLHLLKWGCNESATGLTYTHTRSQENLIRKTDLADEEFNMSCEGRLFFTLLDDRKVTAMEETHQTCLTFFEKCVDTEKVIKS